MIMQFSLQCRKKTTCCEQSLENDKKRCVFKYLPQLIDILTSLMSLLPSSYKKEQFEESVVEKMDEFAIYFKSTFIENPIVDKKPPFPIEMWNQYDAAGEEAARTTNSVEGWQYGLQAYFSGSTPNIWLLLRNLEKDSKIQKFIYVQETAGLLCSKRPRYEKIKKQMQNIRSTYEFENALPYPRAVAKLR